jgi:hypothetical protein
VKALLVALFLMAAAPDAATLLAAPHPETADYYALKVELGEQAFEALQVATNAELKRSGASITATGSCPTTRQTEVLAGLLLARRSTSAADFAADRTAAKTALAKIAPLRARVWALEPVGERLDGVVHELKAARASTDPRLRELRERVAADQFARAQFSIAMFKLDWAAPLSENARRYAQVFLSLDACRVDQANTAWLKADLKANGWPRISRAGEDADHAAWLLAQHADRDVPFQREVLAQLEALLPAKDTAPRSYAYLYDRVATAEKRPQRYATQGRCTDARVWEPLPIEDAPNIDKVRAGVGLESLAEYRARFKCG